MLTMTTTELNMIRRYPATDNPCVGVAVVAVEKGGDGDAGLLRCGLGRSVQSGLTAWSVQIGMKPRTPVSERSASNVKWNTAAVVVVVAAAAAWRCAADLLARAVRCAASDEQVRGAEEEAVALQNLAAVGENLTLMPSAGGAVS